MGYDDIVCKFALFTFNLIDMIDSWISLGCFMNLKQFMCNEGNIVFVILKKHMKYTLSRTKTK